MTTETERDAARPARLRLSQETIAIVTVDVALAGLILVAVGNLRDEARADRAAAQAAAQTDRAAWQAETRQLRDEARADRKHFQRQMETLQRQVVDLTRETATLAAAADQADPQ